MYLVFLKLKLYIIFVPMPLMLYSVSALSRASKVASQNDHAEIVRLLLDWGANLEHQDFTGCTPLMLAARNGHCWETVRLLLGCGANIEQQDFEGRTPLECALIIDGGGHDTVYLLVQAAAQQDTASLVLRRLHWDYN